MLPSSYEDQLLYWCDCQAATLMQICCRKRSSKTEAERQLTIAKGMLHTACNFIKTPTSSQREATGRITERILRAVDQGVVYKLFPDPMDNP